MHKMKRKFILSILVVLSLLILGRNGWSQQIGLPHAFFNGLMQTYLDNGVNDDLVFQFATIGSVVYHDGTLGSTDSILGSTVNITGAKRDPLATPGTTFTDATISISDGVTTYFTATLTDIEFVQIDGLWRLNPDLDINNLPTLNLTDILLNPGPIPSQYIIDLQTQLGSQSVAGMTMTLSTFVGDITGDSQSAILEGLFDGVPAVAPNSPPVADAGATTSNVTCLSTSCEITLDGSQSSDPDSTAGTNDDIVTFEWFENNSLIASGETVQVTLPLGMHDITLRVTDSAGVTDEVTITVVIDPAELSFIEITKAMVKWNDGEIKLKGKVALPAGVSFQNVNSVGSATIGLSTLGNVVNESVDFSLHGNGKKWKYDANPTLGIHKFKIDWHGAKFKYKNNNIEIESRHFGIDATTLEIEFCKGFVGPVDIVIGSLAISIDANRSITVTGATSYDIDNDDSETEVEVVLPFALSTTEVINISGNVNNSILVGDYFTAAVGKFKLDAMFDVAGIDPNALDPKNLTLDMRLGDEGFSGIIVIDPDTWNKITDNKWKYKNH